MDYRPTRSEHEALKAIYRATRDVETAVTGDLAQALDLTPGSVTATIKRLAARGLVDHTPYRGVTLTRPGRRAAVGAIRRHRIVERFLSDMLGYPWHEADRLAGTFEYELPDQVEERLFVALDRPETCPHGFPIPAAEVDVIPQLPSLATLDAGDRAVVAVPGSTQPDVVAFLETLGVRPGVTVEVREKHPFSGPLVLCVDGVDRTVGYQLAAQIYVSRPDKGVPV
jgi:DtxR family transcriptional regulator, Mn-dependent transcriptional regulator